MLIGLNAADGIAVVTGASRMAKASPALQCCRMIWSSTGQTVCTKAS